MAAAAVECFLDQTWHDKELIILDDSGAPSFPDGITGPGIRYFSQPGGTIGAKRNKCCELAAGEIIMHFDDDDYSCPDRITDQVNRILETGAPITGYSSMEFRDGDGNRWLYTGSASYALGTSLAYRKWYWERTKFIELQRLPDGTFLHEDTVIVANSQRCIVSAPAGSMMWASIHPGNTSPRNVNGAVWRKL